ncbi:MAG TPA: hypothetical protein VMY37_04650 [Thermoguttaceae bacterium]|nr:hypothetical protein [Thermoguttaceae bacterium]
MSRKLEVVRAVTLDGNQSSDSFHEQSRRTPRLEIAEDLLSGYASLLTQILEDRLDSGFV